MAESEGAGVWAALDVRPGEVDQVRRLFVAASFVGFALVFFFTGSNALFLDVVGARTLPWVYIANAPLVICAGFGYAAWSRRSSTRTVLVGSIMILAVSVATLWLWLLLTDGPAAPFVAAVWLRFLFIFGLLGLWEIASAVFDTRQAKRLFPAVALGVMLALMSGGAIVGVLTSVIGSTHLILLSAVCFGLYAVAFGRAIAGIDFEAEDAAEPATPAQIVSDRFSLDLAAMRSITVLLIFVTEFIFYDQVEAVFGTEESIARFLGIFMAVSTLAMVIVTATASSRYIARYGVGVGVATMPVGLFALGVAMGIYGWLFGLDWVFFGLVVLTNLANAILTNAIETPVGAVLYQPMPVEQRMPVRVAVDGWLGSIAVLVAGLLLLALDALNLQSVLPVVWLLVAIGAAGAVLARRLYADYLQALGAATTLAFNGSGAGQLLADPVEGQGIFHAGLIGDDPASAFAIASLVYELDEHPLSVVLPDLIDGPDAEVAHLGLAAVAESGDEAYVPRLEAVVGDGTRAVELRADALRAIQRLAPVRAHVLAVPLASPPSTRSPLTAQALAVGSAMSGSSAALRLAGLAESPGIDDRRLAAAALARMDGSSSSHLDAAVTTLLDDADDDVVCSALSAAAGRTGPGIGARLVTLAQDPRYRRPALQAMAVGGPDIVDVVDAQLLANGNAVPEPLVIDLVDVVYASNTRRPAVLHRFVEPHMPSAIRRAGFDALRTADINLPATVTRMVRDDVEFAQKIVATHRDVARFESSHAADNAWVLVALALADEFDVARRAIWAGLRLGANTRRVAELEVLWAGDDPEVRSNAIEALDTLLAHETRQLVLPVLEPLTVDDAAQIIPGLGDPVSAESAVATLVREPRLAASTRSLIEQTVIAQTDSEEYTDMSETIDRVIALKRVDIFSTLPYELLAELATVSSHRSAVAGEQILTEGEFGDELYALTSGEVQVGSTDGVVLSAGTVFGELAVLDPGPRSATVSARSDCDLLVVSRDMLLALTDRRPDVMAQIAQVLARRLRAT